MKLSRGAHVRLSSSAFHILLLVAGAAFLLTDAFHGNVWFDESYSVGIANHSFADIWYYSSGDVHPVLIYWALHVLNLVFGQNITIYRLFTVAGAVAMAVLGYTHVRRDHGWATGVLFSFFALFTPYISLMAVEIRMYSWATFAVMLCFIYAIRIIGTQLATPPARIAEAARGLKCWAGTPRRWWIMCFASSLACAYLHYFGAMSAFMINVVLLFALGARAWRHRKSGPNPLSEQAVCAGAPLRVLIIGCVAQVALYLPWIVTAVTSQMGVVGGTYWAKIVFPTTYIELATYAFLTSPLSFAARGSYGVVPQVLVQGIGYAAAVVLAFLIAWAARWAAWRIGLHRAARQQQIAEAKAQRTDGAASASAGTASDTITGSAATPSKDHAAAMAAGLAEDPISGASACRAAGASADPAVDTAVRAVKHLRLKRFYAWLVSDPIAPVAAALVVYFGVFAISWTASMVMNSMILYYRYLFVAIGPLLFAIAAVLSHMRTKPLVVGVVAVTLAASVMNQALLVRDDYDPANNVPVQQFRETVDRVADQNGGQSPLVVSTDIGYMGVTSVMCPDIPQTYMDWQKGNWDRAYMAYSPTLVSKMSWEIIFDNFHGTFICLGQAQNNSLPRDISDLSQKDGFNLVEYHTYYRPYERTWMTIAVMTKS
ncbi:hypothetical protein [Senegalimassilia anaerobia]|uniref:hypothetical protein n=1 Tax=Senegalimassilia anaerobia TaxID=1473216 RepID=UPI0026710AEC|nr:hypothetical protein [Senegalimassilia anaerobia]